MSRYKKQFLFKTLPPAFTIIVLGMLLSTYTHAVQPMSESDLEFVSAKTGANILNIFGASQAGLKIDDSESQVIPSTTTKLNSEKYQEGEETKQIALKELSVIEENAQQKPNLSPDIIIPKATENSVILSSQQTIGNASAFTTTSEIQYKTSNVHHEMSEIENGGVAVTRDLQIDLLKLENLRGDHFDERRSAGSIYLSNWNSQGSTRIFDSKQ